MCIHVYMNLYDIIVNVITKKCVRKPSKWMVICIGVLRGPASLFSTSSRCRYSNLSLFFTLPNCVSKLYRSGYSNKLITNFDSRNWIWILMYKWWCFQKIKTEIWRLSRTRACMHRIAQGPLSLLPSLLKSEFLLCSLVIVNIFFFRSF